MREPQSLSRVSPAHAMTLTTQPNENERQHKHPKPTRHTAFTCLPCLPPPPPPCEPYPNPNSYFTAPSPPRALTHPASANPPAPTHPPRTYPPHPPSHRLKSGPSSESSRSEASCSKRLSTSARKKLHIGHRDLSLDTQAPILHLVDGTLNLRILTKATSPTAKRNDACNQ